MVCQSLTFLQKWVKKSSILSSSFLIPACGVRDMRTQSWCWLHSLLQCWQQLPTSSACFSVYCTNYWYMIIGDNNHRSWSKCLGLNHLSSLLMVLSADKASRLRFLLPDKSWMGKMESDMLQKEDYLPEGEIIKHWWFLLIQLPSIQLHLPPCSYVFCLSGQLQLILLLLQHAAIFQASSCHRTLQRNERKGRLCCRSEEQIVVWIVIRNGS